MLNKVSKLPLFCLLFVWAFGIAHAQADNQSQQQNRMAGDLDIDLEIPNQDAYAVTQRNLQEFFKTVQEQTAALSTVGSAHIPEIDDNALQFLGAVYLYCSVKNGICPVILDALLESDLINSKLRGSIECPNMNRFWKLWLKNDMEQRHGYLVKMAHLSIVDKFKKTDRPNYVRCKENIEKQIQTGPAAIIDFFKLRYAANSKPLKDLQTTQDFLQFIAEKVPDVYASLGIKFGDGDKDVSTNKSGKKSSKTAPKPAGSGQKTAHKKSIK